MSYFTAYFSTYFRAETVAQGGGYGWNAYDRKKRELEEEADRLEVILAKEGLIQADPLVVARHTVHEYLPKKAEFSRRTQRAIDYAERSKTELAYQLAAKEIAQQIENEEISLLMAIALVA